VRICENCVLQSESSFFDWKGRKGFFFRKKKLPDWRTQFSHIRMTQLQISMNGPLARDAGLSAEVEIARVMNSVIDRLQQEISIRFLSLKN
jgi:hypothetical protein